MPTFSGESLLQSKKKLNTFRYESKEDCNDKENQTGQPSSNLKYKEALSKSYSSTKTQQKTPTIAPPSTPAHRIPLENLIGNTEDAFNCSPPEATPKDHVTWQNDPRSSFNSQSGQPAKPSRKRAHSSSPMSASQDRSFQVHRDPLNLDDIQQSLRTPNNDPSADLWQRYANAALSGLKSGEITGQIFTHFPPSSPQTPSTTSKDSGLRRTASCGVQWPMSKSKRRKVEMDFSNSRTHDIFAASKKAILAPEIPKASRVHLLLAKVQESLAEKQIGEHGPSSSSPFPHRKLEADTSLTPCRVNATESATLGVTTHNQTDLSTPNRSKTTGSQHDAGSSEFGEEGFDVDLLELIQEDDFDSSDDFKAGDGKISDEARQQTQQVHSHPSQLKQVRFKEPPRVVEQASEIPAQIKENSASAEAEDGNNSSTDEFDMDDDTFSEMEDLVAVYDQRDLPGHTGKPEDTAKQNRPPSPSIQPVQTSSVAVEEFEDAFDDDDDDLWLDTGNETLETKGSENKSRDQKFMDNRTIKRYLIANVADHIYVTVQGRKQSEKILSVKDERSGSLLTVLLRQSWYDTRATKGSYVHVIGNFDGSGRCIIDDANNMLILHPDHLISSTVVADSFTCTRRAALQDRVKATNRAEPSQVYGHMLHEIFGEALKINRWDPASFKTIIDAILPNYIESLYDINVQIPQAIDYLLSKTPELEAWANIFVQAYHSVDAVVKDRNGTVVPTTITKLLELEEHIWSPMYGLKGNIDATVEVEMQLPGDSTFRTLTVPLELKTGKRDNVETHRAQTALYTLLLSDRYDLNVTCGVLYYLETCKTFRIEGVRNEIRHMIMERNELACYVHDKLDLPPMIKKEHLCKKCYSQRECFTYHKLIENGTRETSGMKDLFDDLVGHLKPSHQVFFRKWDDLLTKEERDSMKFRRELWTMYSSERERIGRCFSDVVIEPGSAQENLEGSKINRYQYTFVKKESQTGFSFTDSQITIGEPIVISDEQGHFALANGYVTNVRPTRVTVVVDRRLRNVRQKGRDFDPIRNQSFNGLMDVRRTNPCRSIDTTESDHQISYRIDKDEFANGMATARNNILRIMDKDLFRARELRQLVVEGTPPVFKMQSTAYSLAGPASQQDLNIDQQRAIEKVMSAQDYALVLGMPGTGKTTTIAHIIRALVSQGKSVLLTSYTHTAVDNILLKIKDDGIPILRLGAVSKVHPEVQKFVDLAGTPKKSLEELDKSWHGSKVVATTCLGINHGVFNSRIFDYCIVDEASQITLPVCLGPIRMARTFILVGDHYQLPPLVQNKEAQEGGLNVSLFKLLSDNQPDSVVNLEHQYRMAEDIMLLSNDLVYDGRLKCGTTAVATRTMQIPNLESGLVAHHRLTQLVSQHSEVNLTCQSGSDCWIRTSLSPQKRCIFLDTDSLGPADAGRETVTGQRITNVAESTLIAQLVAVLIRAGISPRSIGVITFYRSQLALLRRDIKSIAGSTAASEVETHTADKFQGRDKEVVLLSCVRSNEANNVGELLRDWRRVNVAVTRARSKLIMIGSRNTLGGSGVPILDGMVRILTEKNWILQLPKHAVKSHLFENHQPTQSQPKLAKTEIRSRNQDTSPVSKDAARPALRQVSGNATTLSVSSKNPRLLKPFRVPNKVATGTLNMEKYMRQRPLARDIMNELDIGNENAPIILG